MRYGNVGHREAFILLERDKPWYADRVPILDDRVPILDDRVRTRLGQLSARLGDAEWLDGDCSAGDLMMVEVLLRPAASKLPDDYHNLAAYVARAQARPAFKHAFADQLAVFTASQSGG